MKHGKDCKKQPPREFIPTELGSAVFANVSGRPTDEEYLKNPDSQDDEANGPDKDQ